MQGFIVGIAPFYSIQGRVLLRGDYTDVVRELGQVGAVDPQAVFGAGHFGKSPALHVGGNALQKGGVRGQAGCRQLGNKLRDFPRFFKRF